MRKFYKSAAYRIAFSNFAAYAFGLFLLGLVMLALMHSIFGTQMDSMVADEAAELQHLHASGGNGALADGIAAREKSRSATRMLYAVFGSDGRRIAGSLQARRPDLGRHSISFYDPGDAREDRARSITVDLSPSERLVVAVDTDWLKDIERTVVMIFITAFLASLAIGMGGAMILGSYLQRRLHSISGSAEAIIRGDIRRRMPIGPKKDEFDQLAGTLNRMLDRIEGLLTNLRQVSSDIAHDLRTPLSRLRNHLEGGAPKRPSSDTLIPDAIRQLDEVLALFSAILRVAEVESGDARRFFVPVDVTALLVEVAESYAAAFEDEGRTLVWSSEPALEVVGDRELLAQAIVNLLENAQRHTPPGTVVRLTSTSCGNAVSIQVADNGPGVPNSELGKITKRFARLERSRNTPGHGLGLSLVAAVARLHGGHLVLSNSEPGLSARITVPFDGERRVDVRQSKLRAS